MAKIQLKRSVILNGSNAQEPTASQMTFGEIAVNYNANDPAIFIKDSNDTIIRLAGVNAKGNTPSDIQGYPDITDGDGSTLDNRYLKIGASVGAQVVQSTAVTDFNGGLKVSGGATNLLELAHTGSTKFVVLANGNVGVGIASPTTPLHVNGSVTFTGSATLSGVTSDSSIYVNRTGATQTAFQASLSGTTKVNITADGSGTFAGDIQVGQGSPSTTNPGIYLQGVGGVYSARAGNSPVFVGMSSDADSVTSQIFADGTAVFAGALTGTSAEFTSRVKIATGTEGHADADELTLASAANCGITIRSGTTSTGNIYFSDTNTGVGEYDGYISYAHGSSPIMGFQVNGSEAMRIIQNGNVGLGTTTPAQPLHISNALPVIRLQDTTTDAYSQITSDDAGNVYIDADTGNSQANTSIRLLVDNAEKVRVASSGNVGIGETNPGAGLHVKADTNPVLAINRGSANTANFNLQYNGTNTGQLSAANGLFNISAVGSSTPIGFYANGSERMTITSAGNVDVAGGVTSSDGITLQANGVIKARGDSLSETNAGLAIYRSSNIVARINYNGSAVFNGNVISGGDPGNGANDGAEVNASGAFLASRSASSTIWYGYTTSTSTATSTILANGSATFSGTVTASNVSDIRFKENITDANPQLADAVALGSQLKNFDWNDDAPLNEELRAKRFLGLVAQEAEKVCPGLTYTVSRTKQGKELTPVELDDDGIEIKAATYEELDDSYKAINHDILVMKLLGAVAELSAKVAALEGD